MKRILLILLLLLSFCISPVYSADLVTDMAADIGTDTTNFDGLLSATEDDVQKSLDVLDDITTGHTDGANCAAGNYPLGVDASGAAQSCTADSDTQLTQEQVEDYCGALVEDGTGTHTGIAVTYQDATGDVDLIVDHDAAINFTSTEHFTEGSISHLNITNIGTNAHTVVDTHLANNNQAHTDYLKNDADDSTTGKLTASGFDASDINSTNFGDIALDSISSDAGTTITVTLGTDAGDDFIVTSPVVIGNNIATGIFFKGDTGRVGIGTDAPNRDFHVAGRGSTALFQTRTRKTNDIERVFNIRHTTSETMEDGFGVLFAVEAEDVDGNHQAGRIRWRRDGDDDSYRIEFTTRNAGAWQDGIFIKPSGYVQLPEDNQQLQFGVGPRHAVYSDGNNLVIDPQIVGTGIVHIKTGDNSILRLTGEANAGDSFATLQLADGTAGTIWAMKFDDTTNSFKWEYYNGSAWVDDMFTIDTSGNVEIAGSLVIGEGAAGIDYQLCFDGETNDGCLIYMEDEDRFDFDNDLQAVDITATGLLSGGVVTKTTGSSYTIGTTNSAEAFGGVIYVTGAATITIPAVAAGHSFTVITIGAVAVSVDPNASDKMYLDGVLLDDGDKATNTSTTGDSIVCTYYSADGFYCMSDSPDGDNWTDGGA